MVEPSAYSNASAEDKAMVDCSLLLVETVVPRNAIRLLEVVRQIWPVTFLAVSLNHGAELRR
eukprot:2807280-Amphidinium_carterae.1